MKDWSTGMTKREEGEGRREKLRRPPSSAPRWPSPSSRTPSCFPDRAVRPDCWPGCWGLAHPATTAGKKVMKISRLPLNKSLNWEEYGEMYQENVWRTNSFMHMLFHIYSDLSSLMF